MKKLLSTSYTDTGFNIALFLTRVAFGALMCLDHGISKITNFGQLQHSFFDPFHIGHRWSLLLSITAEVFASLFLVLGFFSRIAAILLLIDLGVAIFLVHRNDPIAHYEVAILFFTAFFAILLLGPGQWSVDAMAGR